MRRWRLAKVLGTTEIDSWTMLLAIAGECAGAVQVGGEEHGDGSGKMPLVDGDLERLLYGFPMDSFAYLSRGARLSIAGAQDKAVLVREEGGGWSVPLGGAPSTHILKPESEEFPGLVENEWYCMELARKAGLETACVDVEVIGGKRVLVVERYDRRAVAGGGLERIHQEDMAQALGRREKYQLGDGPSAYEIARLHGVDPAAFLERMAFNWMIGNCDAHAKNYAILEPGTERARLAPAYDLVCTEVYPKLGRTLALRLGQAKRPGDVTARSMDRLGQRLGLSEGEGVERAKTLGERVLEAAEASRAERKKIPSSVADLARRRAEAASRGLLSG